MTLSFTVSPISKSNYYRTSIKNPVDTGTLNILLIKKIYAARTTVMVTAKMKGMAKGGNKATDEKR